MAKRVGLNDLTPEIQARIDRMISKYSPSDPRMKEALIRIGSMLEGEIKLNIRRKKIIDTGSLFNSIKWQFTQGGIEVGSYGIPYAAIHEFGSKDVKAVQIRAMFASMDRAGKLDGARVSKNVLDFSGPTITFRARPFIRPAVKKKKDRIVKIIQDLVKG
jgi:phage gpG-like protein